MSTCRVMIKSREALTRYLKTSEVTDHCFALAGGTYRSVEIRMADVQRLRGHCGVPASDSENQHHAVLNF